MSIVGLDIGGANIKAADHAGRAISRPFAIWSESKRLKDEVSAILGQFPGAKKVALTMTAELADCFSTKAEGVEFIVSAVRQSLIELAPDSGHEVPELYVWSTAGHFIPAATAHQQSQQISAANWHALAMWSGRLVPQGCALLIDIGTTTTDIIPLVDGHPAPVGFTDVGRLQSGELSYSGVWRTPLCAVAHSVPFRDGYCPLAAELFATMLDVYLLLGLIPENPLCDKTANGKPATKMAAYDRIARTLCCDRQEISLAEATQIARFLADVQRQRLAGALERVVQRLSAECANVIVCGSGEFLARQLTQENRRTASSKLTSLTTQFSPQIAEAACAYAVAQLLESELSQ